MLRVGLTGGIASGKSTVAAMFQELGAHLVDTDLLARQVVEPGSPAWSEIAAAFGPEALNPAGALDRQALRDLIFNDPQARRRLNQIVHPRVAELVQQELDRLAGQDPQGVALVDVPLLFEVGWQDAFDTTVLVYAPAEVQAQRLMARDQVDEDRARSALGAQMPIEEKRRLAQFVVDNSGPLEETHKQVWAVWTALKKLAALPSRLKSDPA